jgi:hypothetical protein
MYTKRPSRLPNDPGFRRLWYVRYADDFLLGFIGTKDEAQEIKEQIREFLKSIRLELSTEKTLITHARTGKARFLNDHSNLMNSENKVREVKEHALTGTHKRRTLSHQLFFAIPEDVTWTWLLKVTRNGAIHHRGELQNRRDDDIITTYEVELQGLINYYSRVHNQSALKHLRYGWKESLLKTLAAKYNTSTAGMRREYERCYTTERKWIIGIEIPREGQKPLRALFGKKPIHRHTRAPRQDDIQTSYIQRNELISRLIADVWELCGRKDVPLVGHHVRKLKDLKKRWQGKAKPAWVWKMIARKRKALFMCEECHQKIHSGVYDGKKRTHV